MADFLDTSIVNGLKAAIREERAYGALDRDSVIRRIKAALKRRSGKTWSVTGGRGTSWGWIRIKAAPSRCTWSHRRKSGMSDWPENYEEYDTGVAGHHQSPSDRRELARLLGLDQVHFQDASIPASSDHYREYIDRAEGRPVLKIAEQYWD